MEKNTTKTEVREKIQELLKTLKAEQEKKPLRLVEQLGYLMYVRLFIESQKRVSLQESFPFAGFPMEWIPGEEEVEDGQRSWQLQYARSSPSRSSSRKKPVGTSGAMRGSCPSVGFQFPSGTTYPCLVKTPPARTRRAVRCGWPRSRPGRHHCGRQGRQDSLPERPAGSRHPGCAQA